MRMPGLKEKVAASASAALAALLHTDGGWESEKEERKEGRKAAQLKRVFARRRIALVALAVRRLCPHRPF